MPTHQKKVLRIHQCVVSSCYELPCDNQMILYLTLMTEDWKGQNSDTWASSDSFDLLQQFMLQGDLNKIFKLFLVWMKMFKNMTTD